MLIFILVCIVLVVGLPITLGWLGYKMYKAGGSRRFVLAIPFLLVSTVLYFLVRSLYPGDDFYAKEFERNTGTPLPASGVVLNKEVSLPDLHGTYTANAIVRVSAADYKFLLQKFSTDPLFSRDTSQAPFLGDTHRFFKAKGISTQQINIVLVCVRKAQIKVGFVNDGKTLVFQRHSS